VVGMTGSKPGHTGQFHWFGQDRKGEGQARYDRLVSLVRKRSKRRGTRSYRPEAQYDQPISLVWEETKKQVILSYHPEARYARPVWFGREPKRLGRQPKKDKRKMLFPFWSLCKK
jgi:hypothetical protein